MTKGGGVTGGDGGGHAGNGGPLGSGGNEGCGGGGGDGGEGGGKGNSTTLTCIDGAERACMLLCTPAFDSAPLRCWFLEDVESVFSVCMAASASDTVGMMMSAVTMTLPGSKLKITSDVCMLQLQLLATKSANPCLKFSRVSSVSESMLSSSVTLVVTTGLYCRLLGGSLGGLTGGGKLGDNETSSPSELNCALVLVSESVFPLAKIATATPPIARMAKPMTIKTITIPKRTSVLQKGGFLPGTFGFFVGFFVSSRL